MQYWRFPRLPGLKPVNRYNLVVAILMFIGSPAWIGMLVFGTLAVALAATPADFIRPDSAWRCSRRVLVMWFAPKTATAIDILLRPDARRAFGGTAAVPRQCRHRIRVLDPAVPIMWFGHTIFLGGLLFGRADRLDRADAR